MISMFLVGLINPYGIKNILYVTTSYGNFYINQSICEMMAPRLDGIYLRFGYITHNIYGPFTYILIFFVISIYIIYKKGKITLRYFLLLVGVTVLSLLNIKNLSLFMIGAILPLALYLKDFFKIDQKENNIKLPNHIKSRFKIIIILLTIYTLIISYSVSTKSMNVVEIKNGVDFLIKNSKNKKMILYTEPGIGSYVEYRGLKPYIDTRAEIFLKANNKKEDIFKEYYLMEHQLLDHQKFLNKYQFTHLIISKTDTLYKTVSTSKDYQVIYRDTNYSIFKKK